MRCGGVVGAVQEFQDGTGSFDDFWDQSLREGGQFGAAAIRRGQVSAGAFSKSLSSCPMRPINPR